MKRHRPFSSRKAICAREKKRATKHEAGINVVQTESKDSEFRIEQ